MTFEKKQERLGRKEILKWITSLNTRGKRKQIVIEKSISLCLDKS